MIHAIDSPLENGKVAFDSISADYNVALFASINTPLMTDCAVLPVLTLQSPIGSEIVSHNVSLWTYVLADDLLERPASDHFRMEGTHISATLDESDHGSLIGLDAMLATMRAAILLPADIGLIHVTGGGAALHPHAVSRLREPRVVVRRRWRRHRGRCRHPRERWPGGQRRCWTQRARSHPVSAASRRRNDPAAPLSCTRAYAWLPWRNLPFAHRCQPG